MRIAECKMQNADCRMRIGDWGLRIQFKKSFLFPHSAFHCSAIFSLDFIQLFSVYFRLPKEATENGVNTKTTRDL